MKPHWACVARMLWGRSCSSHLELCLGVEEERVASLWVRIKGQATMPHTVVGVCYGPPDQEEEVNEALRQLEVTSQSQTLVLLGHFNHPEICWEDHIARYGVQEVPAVH